MSCRESWALGTLAVQPAAQPVVAVCVTPCILRFLPLDYKSADDFTASLELGSDAIGRMKLVFEIAFDDSNTCMHQKDNLLKRYIQKVLVSSRSGVVIL